MLDIDYCNGNSCKMKGICQRYMDYVYRKSKGQDVRYAQAGVSSDCVQFKHRAFTGN